VRLALECGLTPGTWISLRCASPPGDVNAQAQKSFA
jgi:hypothetical protein